jgi:4-diphosphocytidyl-2-C-methyl-D-erythritol kinase
MVMTRMDACAKVNLLLRVGGDRGDGYHEIETIFQTIDICDELRFVEEPAAGIDVRFRVTDFISEPPAPADDLITHAWRALGGTTRPTGIAVEVDKRIPIGGGLGGGSSDAAATLLALNRLWGLGLSFQELADVALSLGSDVPFLLRGGTSLGRSRGEVLTPLTLGAPLWFVLGMSRTGLSTGAVYAEWRPRQRSMGSAREMADALAAGDPNEIAALLRNDLEEPAMRLRPELAEGKAAVIRAGALGAVVSGSGPTVFGVALDREHAHSVAASVRPYFDVVEVARSRDAAPEGRR